MPLPIKYNLRNLSQRKATTLMTSIGIALTVAVLIIALALVAGLKTVFTNAADPLHLIVLRQGTDAELTSQVTSETYNIVRQLPGIARTADGQPMVSPEGLTVVNLPSVDTGEMNVTVRGLLPIGFAMRNVTLVAGHMLTPGLREIVVGSAIAKRYPSAKLGQQLRFGKGLWTVVGVFDAGESASSSEIWVDLNQLRGDFESAGGSSSILINAASTSSLRSLQESISHDQRLNAHTLTEQEYFQSLTQGGLPLEILGFAVAVIMAVGSAFAATNTMYAAVARRAREIGILRAIGFSRAAVLLSFILESVALALIGGILGLLLALPINGLTTAVGNFTTFSETTFHLHVTLFAAAIGIAFSILIGALGGFLPAWAASQKSIVQSMRDF